MPPDEWRHLAPACRRAGLSVRALHLRYVGLGGNATTRELSAHLATGAALAGIEPQLVALAINERFLELGVADRLFVGPGGAAH